MTGQKTTKPEVDERISALISNTSAVRAITGAVEGTLGPLGLDTMLVDHTGDIVITNAGVTILDLMEVSHPAARMMINIARAQHEEIGDGTTTAIIMAGTIVNEGLSKILKGVPVTRIIDGMRKGINEAIKKFKNKSVPVNYPDDPAIKQVAVIAGRGNEDIAENATKAALLVGKEKLLDPSFKLKESVVAVEGAKNEVFQGIILKKKPVNEAMPRNLGNVKILCIDDPLDVEKPEEGSLGTELGLRHYIEKQKQFIENIKKIVSLGIKFILVSRGISDRAEEILTDNGVLVITRLTSRQMRRVCEHTGTIAVRRSTLDRSKNDLSGYLGFAGKVVYDRKHKNIRILEGAGKPVATFLVGASTSEVVEEMERIACDAVSAIQAAVRGGIVAGGGASELAISRTLDSMRNTTSGMSAYGVDCVVEALKRPIAQIIQNAGFNPLEKVEEVISAQTNLDEENLGFDCETGHVVNMIEMKVVDPTLVKLYALKAAGEVAQAILRINTIIKMKNNQSVISEL